MYFFLVIGLDLAIFQNEGVAKIKINRRTLMIFHFAFFIKKEKENSNVICKFYVIP
jgi:hypothetical protein